MAEKKKNTTFYLFIFVCWKRASPLFYVGVGGGGGGVSLFLELEIVDLSSGLLRNDAVLVALVDTVGLRLLLLLHLLN